MLDKAVWSSRLALTGCAIERHALWWREIFDDQNAFDS